MNTTSRRVLAMMLALLIGASTITACTNDEPTPDKENEETESSLILESDNYQISPEEFNVYQYQAGFSSLCTEYWYYQYGLAQDTQGVTKMYDTAYAYAYAMLPEALKEETFASTAYTYAEQYVVYCEGALVAGMDTTLSEEVEAEVDQYMADLKETAQAQDLSLKAFIQKYMGKSVKENDVRSAMKKYILGYKYAEIKRTEFSDALTADELQTYVEENKTVFYKTYYNSYKFTDPALLDALQESFSHEKLITVLTEYVLEQKYHEAYKKQMTDLHIEDPYGQNSTRDMVRDTLLSLVGIQNPETGEAYPLHFTEHHTDAYSQAAHRIVQDVYNQLNKELLRINTNLSASYVDLSDLESSASASTLEQYLFSQGRREGDWNILSHPDGSYEWCLVSKVMTVDEEMTRNVCYVKFSDEEAYTAEEKANAFLYAFLDSKSAEKFDELAVQLEVIEPNTSAMHERVTKTSMTNVSNELSLWLYNEARAVGDAAVIQAGNTYYVAYYAYENEANWCIQARDALAAIKLQSWFEETEKAIHLQSHVDPSEWETQPQDLPNASVEIRPAF